MHRANANDWTQNYEKITDMIVPRSTQLITQDQEFALFNVTLFKKVVEEFKLHAREKKFVVRDFTYNEEELAAGKNEITKLVTDKKKQFVSTHPPPLVASGHEPYILTIDIVRFCFALCRVHLFVG